MNKQREGKPGKSDSFKRLSFVWRTFSINFTQDLHTNWWKIKKKQGLVINKHKAGNVDTKNCINGIYIWTKELVKWKVKSSHR